MSNEKPWWWEDELISLVSIAKLLETQHQQNSRFSWLKIIGHRTFYNDEKEYKIRKGDKKTKEEDRKILKSLWPERYLLEKGEL